jgi:hypothetical protein
VRTALKALLVLISIVIYLQSLPCFGQAAKPLSQVDDGGWSITDDSGQHVFSPPLRPNVIGLDRNRITQWHPVTRDDHSIESRSLGQNAYEITAIYPMASPTEISDTRIQARPIYWGGRLAPDFRMGRLGVQLYERNASDLAEKYHKPLDVITHALETQTLVELDGNILVSTMNSVELTRWSSGTKVVLMDLDGRQSIVQEFASRNKNSISGNDYLPIGVVASLR